MSNSIPCLLDSNAIVKYYSPEIGSKEIQYLFDKSPTAQINITNLHIPEVVSVFHKLHTKKIITADERDIVINTFLKDIADNEITPYACKDKHFDKIYDNFYLAYQTPAPRRRIKYFPFLGGWAPELKELADTLDITMLTLMKEITEIVGESYLFTSDGHVKAIAQKMNLAVLDPETMSFDDIPHSLDKRCAKRREDIRLQAICHDLISENPLGTKHAMDLSPHGACIDLGKRLTQGAPLLIKLRKPGEKSPRFEIKSDVVWSTDSRIGVKFIEPDSISLVSLQ